MKRWCALLCAFAALTLCLPGSAAMYSMTAVYEVPELHLSLELPLEWIVLTRDADADNPALYLYDDSLDYMQDVFLANNIYLDAFNFDSLFELTMIMTPNSDIFDLSLWDEELVSEAAGYFAENPVWADGVGVECFYIGDLYQSGARFLTYNRVETRDDAQLRCMQATTVYNGQSIHIILTDYSGMLDFDSGSFGDVFSGLIGTLAFTEVLPAPDSVAEDAFGPAEAPGDRLPSEVSILLDLLVGLLPAVIAVILILVRRASSRRSQTGRTPMRRTGGARPPAHAVPAPRRPAAKTAKAADPGRPVQPVPDRREKHNCAAQDRSFSSARRQPRRGETVFCLDCGKKVSIDGGRCPHCGARIV